MKLIRIIYFPIMCILAMTIYLGQILNYTIPGLINDYFNDLMCMPIVLKMCQSAIRYMKSNPSLVIPLALQLSITTMYCIYFELVLPKYTSRYTGDWLDVVMYIFGMLFFLIIEQPVYRSRPRRYR